MNRTIILGFIPGLSANVWWILAIVFFILVISSWMIPRMCQPENRTRERSRLDILRKRYIRGEISKDMFLETLKDI
ncbi:MAG: SHOCT domain-containing protein [Chlorobi bacterium]|nr:SHOCT domain-containing protein [Chlorobiota bacterium]